MNDVGRAAGLLQIALRRMVRDYPFHAHLLSAGRIEPDPAVGTMAVTVRRGEIRFLYTPAFVCACTLDELAGVLHHEVNHVLFEHLFADQANYRDREARIIAEEVTVNEWVREPLPSGAITLDRYPDLPVGEDTDTRYRRLAQNAGEAGPKTGGRGQKNGSGGTGTSPPVRPLDNHELWAEARADPMLGKLAVMAAIRRAREALTDAQWQQLPQQLRARIEAICQGREPGTAAEDLSRPGRLKRPLDWRRLLRRYVGRVLERQPVFNRPPRRFPALVGQVPGQAWRASRPRALAVLDTSASMTSATLAGIGGELARLSRAAEVVVVECDAQIQATYPYRGNLLKVHGRGGTDLRPPLAAPFLARLRPDVIVYFTDGEGPAPAQAPRVPVIWCLTPRGKAPVAWGRCVRMSD
jgi:predicted metal-dependent peptidase